MEYILYKEPKKLTEFEQKVIRKLLNPLIKDLADFIRVKENRIAVFTKNELFTLDLTKTQNPFDDSYKYTFSFNEELSNVLSYLKKIKKIAYFSGKETKIVQETIDLVTKEEQELTLESSVYLINDNLSLTGKEENKLIVKELLKDYEKSIRLFKQNSELSHQLENIKNAVFQ